MDKKEFINMALKEGMLLFGKEPFSLKSGRQSRLFFNAGNGDKGSTVENLESVYATIIKPDAGSKPIVCFGLPYKCINVASHAAAGLSKEGVDARWNSYRKEEKLHGGDAKSILVTRGTNIKDTGRVAIVDDVITTGAAKYEAKEVLDAIAKEDGINLDITGVYLMVDRQEVTSSNIYESAIKQFEKQTGIKTTAYITASELIEAARAQKLIDADQYNSFLRYFRMYGAPDVMKNYWDEIVALGADEQGFFMPTERSIVPACDFDDLELFENLVKATADVEKIGGYKVGSMLVEEHGLAKVLEAAKKHTKKPVIYDRQKGGTDIPEIVYKQIRQYARHGYDAHIIFPLMTGTEAMLAAIHSGYENGIKIIVGADMTHQGFRREDGGCVTVEDSDRYYKMAADKGIRNFVMPGTAPERIQHYKEMLAAAGYLKITIFSPGLVTQGGNISAGGTAAGQYFNGIVGRGIYESAPGVYRKPDAMRTEAIKLTKQL